MDNRKWISVLVFVFAIVFLSTTVYAKSSNSYSKKYSKSWWYKPYYQLKMVIKKTNEVQKQISKLQRKANRLERKKNMLEEQLSVLESEIGSLKERKNSLSKLDSNIDSEDDKNEIAIVYCAGCNFYEVDDLDSYDLSWAYLRRANFARSILNNTKFSQANLKSSYFQYAQLNGVIFSGADLSGANFTEAILTNVVWGDDQNGYATCPDGTNAESTDDGSCNDHLTIP